jgi:hypothetical protein
MFGGLDESRTGRAAMPFVERWAMLGPMPFGVDAGAVDRAAAGARAVVPLATSYLKLPLPRIVLVADDVAPAAPLVPAPAVLSLPDPVAAEPAPAETTFVLASVSATEVLPVEAPVRDSESPPPEARGRLVSLFRSGPADEELKPAAQAVQIHDECLVIQTCIDEYLWAIYERTPKVDTNKVTQRIKATVKRKGKTRTVTRTVTKYVLGDFTWKDPIAAKRAGMSLKDYVIGGMDRGFRLKLFRALRAMEAAGHMPGITSAFRDDYRQGIAVGNKAASDSSYHGGSRRGGYGRGLAADLVSVDGATRTQRWASTALLWKWIDANERELGIGRPYLHRDPPHVGPIDGKEFVAKRGRPKVLVAALQTKKAQAAKRRTAKLANTKPRTAKPKVRNAQAAKPEATKPQAAKLETNKPQAAKLETKKAAKLETKKREAGARNAAAATPRAKPAKPSKVSSLQTRATVQR